MISTSFLTSGLWSLFKLSAEAPHCGFRIVDCGLGYSDWGISDLGLNDSLEPLYLRCFYSTRGKRIVMLPAHPS